MGVILYVTSFEKGALTMNALHTLQDYVDALRAAGLLVESTVTGAQAGLAIDCFH